MADNGSIWSAVTSVGVGTALGYIGSAIITARGARKTKADEAGALVEAATTLTDRLLSRNKELAHINAQLRQALRGTIDAMQVAQNAFERFPEIGDGLHNRTMMEAMQRALDVANVVEF